MIYIYMSPPLVSRICARACARVRARTHTRMGRGKGVRNTRADAASTQGDGDILSQPVSGCSIHSRRW